MKVEIWSDYACPFCYIGKTYYENALAKFPHRDRVKTIYRSFELNPLEDSSKQTPTLEVLAQKYGMSIEQVKGMTSQVIGQAKTAGLTFKFDEMISVNTFDCHRLSVFAQTKGVGSAFISELFKLYFTDNAIISDKHILKDVAVKVGLDEAEVMEVLDSDAFAEEVRQEEAEAAQLQVRGVPFFVFDRKYAVSGAQPEDVFTQALERAWNEQAGSLINFQGDAQACGIDGSNC